MLTGPVEDGGGDEVRRLQDCIGHLVSLMALPALWSGHEPLHVVGTLLDVLVRMLRLEFAYARLSSVAGAASVEVLRVGPRGQARRASDVGRTLEPWLKPASAGPRGPVPNPVGDGAMSVASLWLGPERESGVVVAGADRPDFPTGVENLLLRVAVNQAVVELQRAQVLAERDRAEAVERLRDHLHAENLYLRQELDTEQQWGEIVGQSKALRVVLSLVEQVASTDACVLIQGETGTGKELVARAIHRLSGRSERPFVKLNCAAIPTGLLESELFGHEKGAFTGAIAQRVGRFELANHGTIFLDEVGEIPPELQTKLLRVLQEQEFERLGSSRTMRVDVRLVAASNRDLAQMVADREFRSDLYYRLKVFPVVVPPLRDRPDDVPLLVRHFTQHHARRCKKPITSIASETMTALCRYSWPGNVRELENFLERCVILSHGPTLEVPLAELKLPPDGAAAATTTLEDIERQHIRRTLDDCDWVIAGPSGAAAKLGLKRTSLQYKMQRLGISRPR